MELCNVGGSFWSDSLPVERASVWRLYLKTPCKAMRRCIGVIISPLGMHYTRRRQRKEAKSCEAITIS